MLTRLFLFVNILYQKYVVCLSKSTYIIFSQRKWFCIKIPFVFRNICKYICFTAGDLNVIKIVTNVKNSSVFNINGEFMSIDVV